MLDANFQGIWMTYHLENRRATLVLGPPFEDIINISSVEVVILPLLIKRLRHLASPTGPSLLLPRHISVAILGVWPLGVNKRRKFLFVHIDTQDIDRRRNDSSPNGVLSHTGEIVGLKDAVLLEGGSGVDARMRKGQCDIINDASQVLELRCDIAVLGLDPGTMHGGVVVEQGSSARSLLQVSRDYGAVAVYGRPRIHIVKQVSVRLSRELDVHTRLGGVDVLGRVEEIRAILTDVRRIGVRGAHVARQFLALPASRLELRRDHCVRGGGVERRSEGGSERQHAEKSQ